jgi:hypothetical protein
MKPPERKSKEPQKHCVPEGVDEVQLASFGSAYKRKKPPGTKPERSLKIAMQVD